MSAATPAVSAVIVTRDRPDSLARAIRSLGRQDHPVAEVVVVDDASDPPLAGLDPAARLVRNPRSRGASAAKNQGLAEARGEFVLFLDDDAELADPGAVGRAVALAARHPEAAIVGFRQVDAEGAAYHDQPSRSDRPCRAGRFFSYACLGRRRALLDVGGFEELFEYYYEEIELSMKVLDAGHAILFDPALVAVHHQDLRGRDWRRILRLHLRNAFFAAALHYPWWAVAPAWARYARNHLRIAADKLQSRDLYAIGFALAETLRRAPRLWRRRRPVRWATLRRMRRLDREPEPVA